MNNKAVNYCNQFDINRLNILSEYDRLLYLTQNRPIKVAHGVAVEAYIRDWLSEFLPKKYSVTSGYIINPKVNDLAQYHFDIIIYNSLESPVLWVEGNKDNSENVKFRAIPSKYVCAVLEVKSDYTKKNIDEAINHLLILNKFKEDLAKNFSCAMIFVELKKKHVNCPSITKSLKNASNIHNFNNGTIIRFDDNHIYSAQIRIGQNRDKDKLSPLIDIDKIDKELLINAQSKSIKLDDGQEVSMLKTADDKVEINLQYSTSINNGEKSIHTSWSRNGFNNFCICLLNSLSMSNDNYLVIPSYPANFRQNEPIESNEKDLELKISTEFKKIGTMYFLKLNIQNNSLKPITYITTVKKTEYLISSGLEESIEIKIDDQDRERMIEYSKNETVLLTFNFFFESSFQIYTVKKILNVGQLE